MPERSGAFPDFQSEDLYSKTLHFEIPDGDFLKYDFKKDYAPNP